MMRSERARSWLTALATGLLAFAVLAAPALSQQQPDQSGEPDGEKAGKPAKVLPIDLVVDATKKLTWAPADLERLSSATSVRWLSKRERPHPAIPIWDLLKDGGVSKETVKEIRISGTSKTVTLKGEDLATVDQLVLRNAAKGISRAWGLAPLDRALEQKKGQLSLPGVRRVEVITAK